MLKNIIIYSSSAGLQRALTFLAAIILAKSYEMASVGEYAMMQTIAQLIVPILTLNVTVALTREANSNPYGVYKIMLYVFKVASAITVISLLFGVYFKDEYWWLLGISLGATEAIFVCANSYFLGKEKSIRIFAMSFIKILLFMLLIVLALLHVIDIFVFSCILVIQNYVIGSLFLRQAIQSADSSKLKTKELVTPKEMFIYSLATLPHTAALWISVSSDRLLLGAMLGKEVVAQYVVSYTIAQSVMLVVSGVASAMPPRVINDPDKWRTASHVVEFLANLVKACFLIIFASLLFIYFDRKYFSVIPNISYQSYLQISLLGTAFLFSSLYVFYASYLYLNRQTNILKLAGFYLAPLNLIVMILAIYFFEQVGAAVGLLFTYFSFSLVYGFAASRIESVVKMTSKKVIAIFSFFLLAVLSVSHFFKTIDLM